MFESDHWQRKVIKLVFVTILAACGVYVITARKTIAASIIGGIITFGGGNLVELLIENFV
jgi:uncharacterized MnhB-related membrane protein